MAKINIKPCRVTTTTKVDSDELPPCMGAFSITEYNGEWYLCDTIDRPGEKVYFAVDWYDTKEPDGNVETLDVLITDGRNFWRVEADSDEDQPGIPTIKAYNDRYSFKISKQYSITPMIAKMSKLSIKRYINDDKSEKVYTVRV